MDGRTERHNQIVEDIFCRVVNKIASALHLYTIDWLVAGESWTRLLRFTVKSMARDRKTRKIYKEYPNGAMLIGFSIKRSMGWRESFWYVFHVMLLRSFMRKNRVEFIPLQLNIVSFFGAQSHILGDFIIGHFEFFHKSSCNAPSSSKLALYL